MSRESKACIDEDIQETSKLQESTQANKTTEVSAKMASA